MRPTLFAAATAAFLFNTVTVKAQEQCADLEDAAKDACDMAAAFGGSTVVPDIIPRFDPTGALYVTYGTVTIGGAQNLSPSRVNSAPTVAYTPSKGNPPADAKYLLVMVDHDAPTPSNNSLADIVHWIASDLTVGSKGVLSSTTAAPAPYGGPNPPKGSPAHRYVFFLYEQPTSFTLPNSAVNLPATIGGPRLGFKLAAFIKDAKVGDPVAGSFFKSVNDGIPLPAAPSTSSSASASSSTSSGSSRTNTNTTNTNASTSNSNSTTNGTGTSGASNSSASAGAAGGNSTAAPTSGTGIMGFDVLSAGVFGIVALVFA